MKKIEPIRPYLEYFFRKIDIKGKDSRMFLEIQASLKEHVLNRICTHCRKKVDRKLFKTESERHDYHNTGMCKKCIQQMELETNTDLKWLN